MQSELSFKNSLLSRLVGPFLPQERTAPKLMTGTFIVKNLLQVKRWGNEKKTEIENEKLTSFTTNGGTFSSWARNFLEPTLRVSATLFTTYSDAILRFSSLYCGQHTPSRGLKKVEGGTILRRDKSVLCGVHATTHAILLQTRFATGEEKGWRKMSNF